MLFVTAFSLSAATELPPSSPTDVTAAFYIRDGKGSVKGSLKAPTESNDYINPQPLGIISLIEVTRSCWELGESDLPVARFEQAVPGMLYTFEDEGLTAYGYEYTYKAVARNADGEGGYGNYAFVFAGVRPAKPEFVNVKTADRGMSPVTFTLRAEELNDKNEALGMPLTALTLSYTADDDDETSDVISTIENPESGKEYEVTFDASDGMAYEFRIVSECAFGKSESQTLSLFIGEDSPGQPGDIKVTAHGEGAKISWSAPVAGRHNGWVDPASIRYRIERVVSYTNKKLLAEDLEVCEFVDECDDISTLTALTYAVTPYNTLGEGLTASSETVTVGPSASLPFMEHFNTPYGYGVSADNLWTADPDDYNWAYSTYTWNSGGLTGVLGDEENGEGYAYCGQKYSSGDIENRLISTPVTLTTAKYPVLSFWYISRPDAANHLAVGYSADGEEHMLMEIGIADEFEEFAGSDDEVIWVRRVVEMPGAAGKRAGLVFNAIRKSEGNNESVCIDEILLDDYPPVEVFTASFKDGDGAISWKAPSNSIGEPTRYEVALDGADPTEVDSPELPLTGIDDTDHTLRVRAIYGDIPSCWSDEYVFNPLTTGILTIGADGSRTEYYDLSGIRRDSFSGGEILIRRTISPDGSVTTTKVKM